MSRIPLACYKCMSSNHLDYIFSLIIVDVRKIGLTVASMSHGKIVNWNLHICLDFELSKNPAYIHTVLIYLHKLKKTSIELKVG